MNKSFSSNFNFQINTSFGNKKTSNQKMSAQEEYWLDRILRDHSKQIFVAVVLFFILMALVIFYGDNGNSINVTKEIDLNSIGN